MLLLTSASIYGLADPSPPRENPRRKSEHLASSPTRSGYSCCAAPAPPSPPGLSMLYYDVIDKHEMLLVARKAKQTDVFFLFF